MSIAFKPLAVYNSYTRNNLKCPKYGGYPIISQNFNDFSFEQLEALLTKKISFQKFIENLAKQYTSISGMTERDLCKKAKLSKGYITRIKNSYKLRQPEKESMNKLSSAMELPKPFLNDAWHHSEMSEPSPLTFDPEFKKFFKAWLSAPSRNREIAIKTLKENRD